VKVSENLNIWMLGSGQRGRDATWEFMKFCTNKDSMTAWVNMTGAQPARPDVLDVWVQKHANHMPADDIKTLVNENIKHTVESMDHMVVDYYRFDDPYTQGVTAVWDGKSTVQDFLTKTKTTWDATALEIYNQYKDKLLK
jgi:ABC-type glycerol-3-phosphate transport system substrate-binding protein